MDTILSARNEPFKTEKHALNAIAGNPGYRVEKTENGFVGVKSEAMDVICPGCGQCFHETTSEYREDKDANAAMLNLKEPWKGWGWDQILNDPHSGYGCLVCPDCGAALAPSGRLTLR